MMVFCLCWKEYVLASCAFMKALQLDPTNEEIQKAFWYVFSLLLLESYANVKAIKDGYDVKNEY